MGDRETLGMMRKPKRRKRKKICGGAISLATEGVAIEVGSDDILESERIIKSMMKKMQKTGWVSYPYGRWEDG